MLCPKRYFTNMFLKATATSLCSLKLELAPKPNNIPDFCLFRSIWPCLIAIVHYKMNMLRCDLICFILLRLHFRFNVVHEFCISPHFPTTLKIKNA